MSELVIAKKILTNCELVTTDYAGERLHQIKITGHFGKKERLTLYKIILKHTASDHVFCILDNTGRHENILTHEDIIFFDDMLLDAGIKYFYGATITFDREYEKLVLLAKINAEVTSLQGELLATNNREDAQEFILKKIDERKTFLEG